MVSKLIRLFEALSTTDIEVVPLSSVVEIRSGWGFPRADQGSRSHPLPFFKVGDMNSPENAKVMNVANNYISETTAKRLKINPAPAGTIIFPKIGAAIATNKKRMLTQESAYDNNVMGLIPSSCVEPAYLFHWIQTVDLSRWGNNSGAVPSIRKTTVSEVPFPLPPLGVQQEIVRVLDSFTDLERNLAAELELRKKQFEEYRRTLLDNPEGAECRQLGEIVQIQNGKDWKTQEPGEIPVYGSGGRMQQMVAIPSTEGPSVLLPRKGSLEVQYVEDPIWNVDTVFTTVCNAEVLNTRFFYFAMKSVDLGRVSTSATRPSLTQSALKKLTIPVPNLTMQQDIVEKLDAFDLLIQSLEQEIALRRKQYEFYRDELLTFTPKEA